MNVLIIGGTKFVGYLLVWQVVAAGHKVTLLNRGSNMDPFGNRVQRLVTDRTHPEEFSNALGDRQFDAVVDFAAYTGADLAGVLSTLGRGRVGHYILISSGQVYLVREHCNSPAREEDYEGPLMREPQEAADRDQWLYGIHKRQAEDALATAWNEQKFPATRLRLPMVNGERDHYRRMESYLWRILDGGPILLPDGGHRVTRHVYSQAVTGFITKILGDVRTFGQAYNLAQDETPTLAELITQLAETVGAPSRLERVSVRKLVGDGIPPTQISPFSGTWMSYLEPAKAKSELGFKHEPLRNYLEKIVTCFLNHPAATPPENYRFRGAELELASRL